MRSAAATGWRSAVPSLYPVTVGGKTVGIWTAEFEVTNDDEAGVVNAVGNDTFGKAFEVLNDIFAAKKR
jgi:hypothetical protein